MWLRIISANISSQTPSTQSSSYSPLLPCCAKTCLDFILTHLSPRLHCKIASSSLFDVLLFQPFAHVQPTAMPVVLLLDALDELPSSLLQPVLHFVTVLLMRLPHFVRVFVTSRSHETIRSCMEFQNCVYERNMEENTSGDLRAYLQHIVSCRPRDDLH